MAGPQDLLNLIGSILPYIFKPWEWANEPWTFADMPHLYGKVALVTGANGGIGLETSYELVRKGAHVFIGTRSPAKFDMVRKYIQDRISMDRPHLYDDDAVVLGKVERLKCDLSTMETANESADAFIANGVDRLDIFIACAGVGTGVSNINMDGIEPFMAINCVNQIAMLKKLMPIMLKTSRGQTDGDVSSRIVFVSSVAHQWASFSLHRPTFQTWRNVNDRRRTENQRYSQSKLAQILFSRRLQLELSDENITCISLHPGEVHNNFVKQYAIARLFAPILEVILLNAREGARTCLFAATAKEVDQRNWRGVYLTYPCQLAQSSSLGNRMQLAQQCWTLINETINEKIGKSSWT